ncbi:MAG: thermonuclease family protein [Candidatus Roizmanbacteria bacterium]
MKFYVKLSKKKIISIFTTIFILSQIILNRKSINLKFFSPSLTPTLINQSQTTKVIRVIDGDTIEIENGQKIRYIGINSPELHDPRRPVECFAQEAYEENKKLIEGKTVKLEKDISETDKYKRLLRYVYVDGTFINDYLVRQGFAQVSTFPPDVKYVQQFLEAENEARENNRGLWIKCSSKQK